MKQRTKQQQLKIIALTMISVIVIIALLMGLTNMNHSNGQDTQKNQKIIVTYGNIDKEINLKEIEELPSKKFETQIVSSKGREEVRYEGVLLSEILVYLNLDASKMSKAVVKGADGYVSTVKIRNVQEKDNVYIVFKMNGEEMKAKAEGGYGPFQLVIRMDQFSQRWCKYVSEVEMQ